MKRQIFTLLMVLVLASMGSALLAQTANTQVPPSQQVDQSGQPEHTGRPDVDVDTGKNANNGVLDVDVKRNGDSDTKAGNNPNGNRMGTNTTGTTGTTGSMNTGTTNTTTNGTTGTDTSTGAYSGNDTTGTGSGASGSRNMPRTASDMPLVGLLGALALAGALGLRSAR